MALLAKEIRKVKVSQFSKLISFSFFHLIPLVLKKITVLLKNIGKYKVFVVTKIPGKDPYNLKN
jgi:hypothetical protein